jgi:transposase
VNPLPRTPYPSDLTDEKWAVISPILLTQTPIGRRVDPVRTREYLDAILYVLRTGCPWRHLPHDNEVNWSSVHKRFLRWTRLAGVRYRAPRTARADARREKQERGANRRRGRFLQRQSQPRGGAARLRLGEEDRRHQTPHPGRLWRATLIR